MTEIIFHLSLFNKIHYRVKYKFGFAAFCFARVVIATSFVAMAVFKMYFVVSIFTIGYFNGVVNSFSSEIVNFNHLNNCNISEYFNSDNLKCYNCDPKKNLVPSVDS